MSNGLGNIFLGLFFLVTTNLSAQLDSMLEDYGGWFTLDSIVVIASDNGLDINDMITKIKEDESFYKAFKNIRTIPYSSKNNSTFYKKNKVVATQKNEVRQLVKDNCGTIEFKYNTVTGNLMKRKEYRYFTSKMFARLFYYEGEVCHQTEEANYLEQEPPSRMEEYVRELKRLIFNPGSPIDLPFMGKKTDLFSPEIRKYYDYNLYQANKNGEDCYVMDIKVKPAYELDESQTVIRHLVTYFNTEDFTVINRSYHLLYSNMLFSFDVDMDIDIEKLEDGKYVPTNLLYDGSFKIPTKRRETATFASKFSY